jgi:hypothetical protein
VRDHAKYGVIWTLKRTGLMDIERHSHLGTARAVSKINNDYETAVTEGA